jgi:hypothetical protein
MGEYADLEVEREIDRRGWELARQHARQTPAQRRAEAETNRKAQSEVWVAAFAAATARKAELDEAGIVITLHKGRIEAKRSAQVLGTWFPHKRGTIGRYGCPRMPAAEWAGKILKLARKSAPRPAAER